MSTIPDGDTQDALLWSQDHYFSQISALSRRPVTPGRGLNRNLSLPLEYQPTSQGHTFSRTLRSIQRTMSASGQKIGTFGSAILVEQNPFVLSQPSVEPYGPGCLLVSKKKINHKLSPQQGRAERAMLITPDNKYLPDRANSILFLFPKCTDDGGGTQQFCLSFFKI